MPHIPWLLIHVTKGRNLPRRKRIAEESRRKINMFGSEFSSMAVSKESTEIPCYKTNSVSTCERRAYSSSILSTRMLGLVFVPRASRNDRQRSFHNNRNSSSNCFHRAGVDAMAKTQSSSVKKTWIFKSREHCQKFFQSHSVPICMPYLMPRGSRFCQVPTKTHNDQLSVNI